MKDGYIFEVAMYDVTEEFNSDHTKKNYRYGLQKYGVVAETMSEVLEMMNGQEVESISRVMPVYCKE